MIFTCTFNPSLDYYMEFDHKIEVGHVNRSSLEYYEAGGKGINVSIVLNNLRMPSFALGFVGGFTKEFYLSLLHRYEYLQPLFITVEGHTRINVKVEDKITTELNAQGPSISYEDQLNFLQKLNKLDEEDYFILSGNIQNSLIDLATKVIEKLEQEKIKFVLDTDAKMMKSLICHKPILIKPNLYELQQIFDKKIVEFDDIVLHAEKLLEMGARNVIVSLGSQGSILANKNGVYKCDVLDDVVKHTTGAGDSMVAGFIFSLQRGFNEEEAFRYANCCSLATTYSKSLATKEKIEYYYELTNIEKIK